MHQHPYPHFLSAIEQLAETDRERAAILGVSRRQVVSYRMGDALPRVEIVKRHPTIDDALTLDLRPIESSKNGHIHAQITT